MSGEIEGGDKTKRQRSRRTRQGMATTSGNSQPVKRDSIMRTIAIIDAALRFWEAKQTGGPMRSVWQRRPKTQEQDAPV